MSRTGSLLGEWSEYWSQGGGRVEVGRGESHYRKGGWGKETFVMQ